MPTARRDPKSGAILFYLTPEEESTKQKEQQLDEKLALLDEKLRKLDEILMKGVTK